MTAPRPCFAALTVLLAFQLFGLIGCQSSASDDPRTITPGFTAVSADLLTTTQAAKAILTGHNLVNITSQTAGAEGSAIGARPDGSKITVTIHRRETGSEIAVASNVVVPGDAAFAGEIVGKIKAMAEGK